MFLEMAYQFVSSMLKELYTSLITMGATRSPFYILIPLILTIHKIPASAGVAQFAAELSTQIHKIFQTSSHKLQVHFYKMLLTLSLLLSLLQVGISLAPHQAVTENDAVFNNIENPVQSCNNLPNNSQSGYYFISNSTGSVNLGYCDTENDFGTRSTGWMRVVNLDMTDANQNCPQGLTEKSGRRCARATEAVGCSSVVSVHMDTSIHECAVRSRLTKVAIPPPFVRTLYKNR